MSFFKPISSSSESLPDLILENERSKKPKRQRKQRLPSDRTKQPRGWPEFVDAIPSSPIRDQIYSYLTNAAKLELVTLLKFPKHFDSIKSTTHWAHCCLVLKIDSKLCKYLKFLEKYSAFEKFDCGVSTVSDSVLNILV